MYEFGEGKTLLKTSEVRPEGFSYYNRVYNSHEAEHGLDQDQGQIYNEPLRGHEGYQEVEDGHGAGHHDLESQYHPASDGQVTEDITGPETLSASRHIDSRDRDQFRAEPDVRQYYHFHSQQSEGETPAPYIPSYARGSDIGDKENYQHYIPAEGGHRDPPPVYEEPHHSEQILNRFSQGGDDIEYPDVQFYDDFDDYGIELEFENELRRLTEADESGLARSGGHGGQGGQGLRYPGSDLMPRVYVGGGHDYGEDIDFHYPSDFDY